MFRSLYNLCRKQWDKLSYYCEFRYTDDKPIRSRFVQKLSLFLYSVFRNLGSFFLNVEFFLTHKLYLPNRYKLLICKIRIAQLNCAQKYWQDKFRQLERKVINYFEDESLDVAHCRHNKIGDAFDFDKGIHKGAMSDVLQGFNIEVPQEYWSEETWNSISDPIYEQTGWGEDRPTEEEFFEDFKKNPKIEIPFKNKTFLECTPEEQKRFWIDGRGKQKESYKDIYTEIQCEDWRRYFWQLEA
jgi:hypothetical protein